jgi:hypothetical protein
MGLGDKFKDLKQQAQKSVAEHRDQIDDAVGVVGMAVDKKTKGRHTQRIAKFGQKASAAVDKLGAEEQSQAPTTPPPTEPAAPEAGESAPRS